MTALIKDDGSPPQPSSYPKPVTRPSRQEVTEAYLDALVMAHRRTWAAPGPMLLGRAEHFRERLGAYLTWYRALQRGEPCPVHLAAVSAQMLQFDGVAPGERTTPNPWVRDADFLEIHGAATALPGSGAAHGGS